jgi:nucleotide-binding universal stress UspA family protein
MDDSEAQTALVSAAGLALRYNAKLEVFGCVEPPHDLNVLARLSGRDPDALLDTLFAHKKERMQAKLAQYLPDRQIDIHLKTGKAFIEIVRHVITNECDFVVKQAEPLTGMHRLLFASTDQHLLRKCPCPVWLQPSGVRQETKRVIAAVDVDLYDAPEPETLKTLNRRVIQTACLVAAPTGAQVVVLHVWDAVGEGLAWAFSSKNDPRLSADLYINEIMADRQKAMERLLAEVRRTMSDSSATALVPRLIRGAPERVIEEQSVELGADVVVMGTVARTGLSGVFIGNTAENIINSLECPVLAVKPDGFVSPLDQAFGTPAA